LIVEGFYGSDLGTITTPDGMGNE